MAQFFAYNNPNPATRKHYPYLLDIQSELSTTVVIPLAPVKTAAVMRLSLLNPTLDINGESYIAITQELAGIERHHLGAEACDASHYRAEIIAAVDFMLAGILRT